MGVHLFRVILPVGVINQAATFYAALLEDPGERVSPGRHYFDCGGTILACFDPKADGDGWEATPNPDHVYLAVDDLEAVLQRARGAGAQDIAEKPIAVRPWGERSFYCKDPFGNRLCFVERGTEYRGGAFRSDAQG